MAMKTTLRRMLAAVCLGIILFTGMVVHRLHTNEKALSLQIRVCEYTNHTEEMRDGARISPSDITGSNVNDTVITPRTIDHTTLSQGQKKGSTITFTDGSNEDNAFLTTKERLDARLDQVVKVCNRSDYANSIKPLIVEERRLAFGRLIYCPIAKTGTTFMRRDLTPTLRKLYDDEPFLKSRRKTFFVVREPFSRLVSAYFSKIVGLPFWWNFAGRQIIKIYRPNATEHEVRCGYDATFPEFIKYVIASNNGETISKDPHFTRMMGVCNICQNIPHFVAKLETIKDDMQYILKSVDVEGKTNTSFIEVGNLALLFMKHHERRNISGCGSMCKMLERYWYGQQATGLIADDIDLPVKGKECEKINGDQLADLAWDAYQKSVGRINKHEKKRSVLTELYQSVSLEDREELARILSLECEIFGYDPRPDFVFPRSN